MSGNLYEIVTLKIIESLNRGVVPWKKPWHDSSKMPVNLVSNKPYRGVNPWLLSAGKFADHRWLTFKQAQEIGATVRTGEKSTMVVFWKFPEQKMKETEEELKVQTPVLRYYNVFNVEQIDGLSLPDEPEQHRLSDADRIGRAELFIDSMPNPPAIEERGTEAWYLPSRDLVRIPQLSSFDSIDSFYATKFHELVHSTGHKDRLNRSGVMVSIHFGSEEYSREELVAELGSAYCCSLLGLDGSHLEDSASYIDGWLKSLKADPKAIVIASAQAQKAADYIRGVSYL
ncbi:MAG: DUF1738 domain-containing protein [Armatimonadetes bacterium]|nr:DUF1738 domain-containing protein [Armatimonadota bacterium]